MKHLKKFEANQPIIKLDYSYQGLKELPTLPNTIRTLICNDNNLTNLPELPESLEYLVCSNNELTELPELPESLEYLVCSNNKLIRLPELPESLEYLKCVGNSLPYNNIYQYIKWYAKTYPERVTAKKYNL